MNTAIIRGIAIGWSGVVICIIGTTSWEGRKTLKAPTWAGKVYAKVSDFESIRAFSPLD